MPALPASLALDWDDLAALERRRDVVTEQREAALDAMAAEQWPVESAAKICPVFRHLTGD